MCVWGWNSRFNVGSNASLTQVWLLGVARDFSPIVNSADSVCSHMQIYRHLCAHRKNSLQALTAVPLFGFVIYGNTAHTLVQAQPSRMDCCRSSSRGFENGHINVLCPSLKNRFLSPQREREREKSNAEEEKKQLCVCKGGGGSGGMHVSIYTYSSMWPLHSILKLEFS